MADDGGEHPYKGKYDEYDADGGGPIGKKTRDRNRDANAARDKASAIFTCEHRPLCHGRCGVMVSMQKAAIAADQHVYAQEGYAGAGRPGQ